MDINDNTISAFMAGKSSIDEDRLLLAEFFNNEYLQDVFEIINEIDTIDNMDELRKEFNENHDISDNFSDYNINIK